MNCAGGDDSERCEFIASGEKGAHRAAATRRWTASADCTIEDVEALMQVFCDFDGTITQRDTIVFLTEELGAGPEFRSQALQEIQSGAISVYEAIGRELATVTATWPEASQRLLEEIEIDPAFPEFVEWCRSRGWPLVVVSSGIEAVLQLYLRDLDVPLYAHPVEFSPDGWVYRRRADVNKESLLKAARKKPGEIVYVGDGTSDVQVIPYVDRLFAKAYLADYCSKNRIVYERFQTFRDVQRRLGRLAVGEGR